MWYSQTTYDIVDATVNESLSKKGADAVTNSENEVSKTSRTQKTNIVNKVISSLAAPSFNLGFSPDKEKVEARAIEKGIMGDET
ncbi:hypothetical protein L6452_38606 [Arctium lappa]|uniref:Uncharacterized protein n=1 Tax=Arctium lappa TaxID=4217 RepID=A0ACB8XPL7_ARCLA|nr:hypothetical protein L6452_38606 [Arctium lappa]